MIRTCLWSLALLLGSLSCNAQPRVPKAAPPQKAPQTSNTRTMERFDFEDFKRRTARDPDGNIFTRPDGVQVEMMDGEEPFIRETPPPPAFDVLYKEFYANGALKAKGHMIGPVLKTGLWQYFGPDGRLQREVNENARFGRIGPAEVLAILEREGYINRRTGKGRETTVLNYERKNSVIDGAGKAGIWIVELTEGARNTPPFRSIGEPSAFKSLFLEIDGETGKILRRFTDD